LKERGTARDAPIVSTTSQPAPTLAQLRLLARLALPDGHPARKILEGAREDADIGDLGRALLALL
jgi:hypothetical protein